MPDSHPHTRLAEPPLGILIRLHAVLSAARTVEEAFLSLGGPVWSKLGFVAGHLWVPDPSGTHLLCFASWPAGSITPHSSADYGSSGRNLQEVVWVRRQVKWLTHYVVQDGLTHTELLVCVPLLADGQIVGVLELAGEGVGEPNGDELALLGKLGRRLGEFVDRTGM